jgi:chloride channel protein, CIC family
MLTPSKPSPHNPSKGVAWIRAPVDRIAALWVTPRIRRVALCSPLVGLISGLGAVGFLLALHSMFTLILGGVVHFRVPSILESGPQSVGYPWPWWLVVLVPAVGGLISGIIVFTLAPEAERHSTDAMIRAFHRGGGNIRACVPAIKAIASIITIGTGGSAG